MERTIYLPNNIALRIILRRLYVTFDIDTWGSAFDLKDTSKLLDLYDPYRHKKFRAYMSKTSVVIFGIKREHMEELTQKLVGFLSDPDNLVKHPTIFN